MPPEVLRNPIDEIYGYTCKKKTQTLAAESSLHTGCTEYTPAFDYSVICLRARTESPNMPAFEALACTALTRVHA